MSKAKFEVAKAHIKAGKYSEALAILKTVDHPTAREWEAKIQRIQIPYPDIEPSVAPKEVKHRRYILYLLVIWLSCGICAVLTVHTVQIRSLIDEQETSTAKAATAIAFALTPPSETPTTTPTVTETPSPSPTYTVTPSATVTFTYTPKPTLTASFTPIPTATDTEVPTEPPSIEDEAREALTSVIGNQVEQLNVFEFNLPPSVVMAYPMPGLASNDYKYASNQMLRMACALYAGGFTSNWQYQFSAMIDVVNRATGQKLRRDGLTIWVKASRVAGWDCSNTSAMDASLIVDGYSLDPLLQQ